MNIYILKDVEDDNNILFSSNDRGLNFIEK